MRALIAMALVFAASMAVAAEKKGNEYSPPYQMPRPQIEPDAPAPEPGGPPPDAAFGAYQRGYFITALREATARVAADSKDAAAMTLIGEIYRDGLAVKLNMAEAARWYRLASALGDPQAAFQLGVMQVDGAPGVPKDVEAAKALFAKAALAGHAGALYNLGVLAIEGGADHKPDFAKAADYFRRAYDAGDANAAYSYGVMLREGKGVPKDVPEAVKWLKRAADAGIIAGQVEYAIMLFNGVGVASDEGGAAKIFALAAARRNPIAQNRLAHLYAAGRGVPKDIVQAALWNSFAKAAGLDDPALDSEIGPLSAADNARLTDLIRRQAEF